MILYFIVVDMFVRMSGKFDDDFFEVKGVVYIVDYMNISVNFIVDLFFGVEDMCIILCKVVYVY